MNKLLISLLIIFFTQTVLATQQIPIEIIEIKDGDTVLAKLENGNKFVIRLYGIDCYESKKIHRAYKQAYLDNISIDDIVEKGLLTKQYLKNEHAKSSTTTFSFIGVDIYKRILGILYFDGININDRLVKNNYCKNYLYQEQL